MKKITIKSFAYFIMIFALALGQACEGPEGAEGAPGPEGPQGPQGPTGPAGPATIAKVLEFGADFEANDQGDYEFYLPFDALAEDGIEVQESDVVLLYMFRGGYQLDDGTPVYVWGPMPQLILTNQGSLQYNYIHTFLELLIYIDSQIDLSTLSAEQLAGLTTDQAFRMVVIPGQLMNGRTAKPQIDFNNYNEVAKYFNLSDKDVQKVTLD